MEQSVEKIKELLDRYFETATTEAEEQLLREFFRRVDVPVELRYAQTMFGGFGALAREEAPRYRAVSRKSLLAGWVRWAAPLAAAAVVGVFLLASYLRQPYCYINGVAVYNADEAMAATVYFDRLEAFDRPVEMLDDVLNQINQK